MAELTRTPGGRRTLGVLGALALLISIAVPFAFLSGSAATAQEQIPRPCVDDVGADSFNECCVNDVGADSFNECCELQAQGDNECCFAQTGASGFGNECCEVVREGGLGGDECCEELDPRQAGAANRGDSCEPPPWLCRIFCEPIPTPTPTETPTPTTEATPEPTPEPTPDPTPDPTPEPTPTPDVAGAGIGFTG